VPLAAQWCVRGVIRHSTPSTHTLFNTGCRGCIAADAERGPQPLPPALVRGAVTVAGESVLAPLLGSVPDAERRACWSAQRRTLESLVDITSAGVVDEDGFGVVAKQPLRANQIIVDPTVLLVPRPSDYARAHLPPYDYIAFGANDYALLREVALKHCSLTFYLNGADYAGSRPVWKSTSVSSASLNHSKAMKRSC
jgi:hypothetical protein